MRVLFAFLILAVCSPSFAALKVEYKVSRIHGLVQFALALSDDPHQAPGLKEVWMRSRFQSAEVKKAVEDLKLVSRSLSNGLDFNSRVKSRPLGTGIDSLIVTQSLYAKDLSDLATRTLGLLPMSETRLFFSSLKVLEPVYEQLVWNPYSKDVRATEKALNKIAERVKVDSLFSKTVKFYGASWPADVPFVIGLHAIPWLKDFKNSTSSTSFASVEVHGVQTGVKQDDVEDDFGVVFHELCHSIYGAQSAEVMGELENWFYKNPSPYARPAYVYLNEALATALGNGWAYEKARGKADPSSWYNDPTIDAYAKAIVPLVKEYVESEKPIDAGFVDRAVKLFASALPDSIHSYRVLLNKLIAIHNGSFLENTDLREVRFAFNLSSFQGGAPLLAEETLSDVNTSGGALLLALNSSDLSDFDLFSKRVPFLKSRAAEIKKMPARSYYASTAVDGRLLLVVRASSLEEFKAALAAIKKAEKMTPGKSVYEY